MMRFFSAFFSLLVCMGAFANLTPIPAIRVEMDPGILYVPREAPTPAFVQVMLMFRAVIPGAGKARLVTSVGPQSAF